ncbi:histidine kinase [Shewanella sp. D64]|nr:histidine kinase [Shewanella sp. MTB7]MEC4728615.1 histidine kinase [Shewanella sp. D64]MEC4737864.1 histidine kinase [Shewanella sp. E94]WBJ98219.1 histidine kinase [Shewanella sp. MTB7]
MLLLAGIGTWCLVAWLGVSQTVNSQIQIFISIGYLLFIGLFLFVASHYLYNHKPKLLLPVLMAQAAITLYISHYTPTQITPILLVIWASQLPDVMSKRAAIINIIIVNGLLYLMHTDTNDSAAFTVLMYVAFQFFAYSSSQARLNEFHARVEQEQLNQQLVATRSLLSQSSQQQERLRIARDLHDILGHQLTALSLQLELLSHKVPGTMKPEVEQSKNLSKELLTSIRAVVRKQRDICHLDLTEPLTRLMARLPGVELSIQSPLKVTSTDLAQALLLILQEGISNAVRHGGANKLTLVLEKHELSLKLKLKDNGNNKTTMLSGSGLKGMKERLAPFNGQINLVANTATSNTNSLQSGYTLHITCTEPNN